MTVTVMGYVPAWGLPDISPYVTKTCFFLTMRGVPFEWKGEDLANLDKNSPFGKLPYIIDDDKPQEKIADSNTIIEYVDKKLGKSLDDGLSPTDKATAIAFDRLINEHLYFSGVLEVRWRSESGWQTYVPYIVQGAEVTPQLKAFLDSFRERIMNGFVGQGMGRRNSPTVLELYKKDIDALSDFMGDKKYFMGDKLRNIDASVYSILRHLVDQPMKWEGDSYIQTKKNLMGYLERMRAEFNI